MARAYPKDLAALAAARWDEVAPTPVGERGVSSSGRDGAAPRLGALEELLDACYQASLMREEERAVNFRLVMTTTSPEHLEENVAAAFVGLSEQDLAVLAG